MSKENEYKEYTDRLNRIARQALERLTSETEDTDEIVDTIVTMICSIFKGGTYCAECCKVILAGLNNVAGEIINDLSKKTCGGDHVDLSPKKGKDLIKEALASYIAERLPGAADFDFGEFSNGQADNLIAAIDSAIDNVRAKYPGLVNIQSPAGNA